MKDGIHPAYHDQVTVTCSCGTTFTTGSTVSAIHVEVCSNCHPFYSGKQKLVDTAGRVDKFRKRLSGVKTVTKKARRMKHDQTATTVKLK